MKGIIFTEFLEMVEERFTPEVADRIITACDLASGGAYTAVGTYDHHELVQLVGQLSAVTGMTVTDLVQAFGIHLFRRLAVAYPQFFEGISSAFAFLQRVEDHIHVEVRKLYPEAELPAFVCDATNPDCLTMVYQSTRPFAALAEGLIRGCIAHFGEAIDLCKVAVPNGHETCVRFVLTRRSAP